MQEEGIEQALTGDVHLQQAGFRILFDARGAGESEAAAQASWQGRPKVSATAARRHGRLARSRGCCFVQLG